MSAEPLNEVLSFSPSFCCSFNLSKKEMDTKELIRGGYEDGRGEKRESRSDAEKSSAA